MENVSSIKFCDTVDDAETISLTFKSGNKWIVQLESGRFNLEAGCLTFLNDEPFMSYEYNAEEEQAISAAEDFYKKNCITNKQDKAYAEASQALTDGGIAMTKLLNLYKNEELPLVSFMQYMDSMKSTVQAKLIEGIKHEQ